MRHGARVVVLSLSALLALLFVGGPALAVVTSPLVLAQEDEAEEDETEEETDAGEDEADPAEDEEEARQTTLFGTFRADGEPVEGVEIVVTDETGTEVGRATSEANGSWEVELDEGGDYVVIVESLPEDVELRDPDQDSTEVTVGDGDRRAVPFPLGDPPEIRGLIDTILQSLVNGIRFGLIIAMMAVGLSLVFGTTGLINFAHGEIVVFGAFMAWMLGPWAGLGLGWPVLVTGPIAVVLTAALGGGIDRGLFRPLRRRGVGLFQLLVITVGMSLALRSVLQAIFGGRPRVFTDFLGQDQVIWGPIVMTPRDLIIMGIALAVLVLVGLALMYTRLGKAMRAVADNRDLAESSGIDVEKVVGRVWIYGAGLAGLGGVLYANMFAFNHIRGFQLLLLMFAGIILGGLGTAFGAMVGSLVVGMIIELSTVWFAPDLQWAWALGLLIVVLLVRPQGLLGRRERIG